MKKTDYLNKLFNYLGVEGQDLTIDIEENKDTERGEVVRVTIPEDKAGYIIGFKGETLDSIELLFNLSVKEKDKKIILDINEYKKQKEDRLLFKARRLAEKVLENNQEQNIWSLNSYERFLVHTEISENPDFSELETISQDDYEGRTLIIRIKN